MLGFVPRSVTVDWKRDLGGPLVVVISRRWFRLRNSCGAGACGIRISIAAIFLVLASAVVLAMLGTSSHVGASAGPAADAIVLHVATTGNDKNDGVSQPVRSIDRALAIARAMRKAGRVAGRRVEVAVAGGTYVVESPITLSGEDSGSPGFPLVIRGQSSAPAVVAGGPFLTRWTKRHNGELQASLPGEGICPQQLFVNGTRRSRPRLPARDFYEIAAVPGEGRLRDRFHVPAGILPNTFQPDSDTEVVVLDAWIVSRMRLAGYDVKDASLRLQNSIPGRSKYGLKPGVPFYLDNVPVDALMPGDWRCDPRSRTIRYRPLPEERGKPIVAAAPAPAQLLVLQGSDGDPVHDVEIRGLQFAYTAWHLPPRGWRGHAKETGATGVLEMTRCRAVRLQALSVEHSGGAGVVIGNGCSDVELTDSRFHDLGGGGVAIGGARRKIPEGTTWRAMLRAAGVTHDIRIERNQFIGMGRVLAGSPGIWSGQAHHVSIVGNTIRDLFWSGIDVGWIHGGGPGQIESNRVLDNRIDLYGQGVLSDMGGIHMVGPQPGTIVQGNEISRGSYRVYGAWGLYSDESNEGVAFINNHISQTQSAAIHVHKPGPGLVFRGNTAERVGEAGIRCTKGDPEIEVLFDSNTIRLPPGVPPTMHCFAPVYLFRDMRVESLQADGGTLR